MYAVQRVTQHRHSAHGPGGVQEANSLAIGYPTQLGRVSNKGVSLDVGLNLGCRQGGAGGVCACMSGSINLAMKDSRSTMLYKNFPHDIPLLAKEAPTRMMTEKRKKR